MIVDEPRHLNRRERGLVRAIEAEGYTVEWVDWCEDPETPGLLGYAAGITVHERKVVKVRTHEVEPGWREAILRHELDHVRGIPNPPGYHEGLHCGGRHNGFGDAVPIRSDAPMTCGRCGFSATAADFAAEGYGCPRCNGRNAP